MQYIEIFILGSNRECVFKVYINCVTCSSLLLIAVIRDEDDLDQNKTITIGFHITMKHSDIQYFSQANISLYQNWNYQLNLATSLILSEHLSARSTLSTYTYVFVHSGSPLLDSSPRNEYPYLIFTLRRYVNFIYECKMLIRHTEILSRYWSGIWTGEGHMLNYNISRSFTVKGGSIIVFIDIQIVF